MSNWKTPFGMELVLNVGPKMSGLPSVSVSGAMFEDLGTRCVGDQSLSELRT